MKKFPILLLFFIIACNDVKTIQTQTFENQLKIEAPKMAASKLDNYWYQGKAELNRYALQQNRYRDVHPGEAVLVFVTEDFLTDQQVKNDRYQNPNSINVLKTNIIKRFATGIYDYSIMTSVFTPTDFVNHAQTLKVTTSSQDWCGQVFMQLNWRNQQYQTQIRSYFETEGDENVNVPYAILEDELFNRIRMNPQGLPLGNIQVLPSLHVTRLLHTVFKPEAATASLAAYAGQEFSGKNLQVYQLYFTDSKRSLEIVFEKESPYLIAGWKEAYPSFDGKVRETIAKRTNTVVTDYWQQHDLRDSLARKALGVQGMQ